MMTIPITAHRAPLCLRVACWLLSFLWLTLGGPGLADTAPPPAVTVVTIEERPVEQTFRYIGAIRAIESVELRARVEGFLEEVAFEQGGPVRADDLLYRIEQAPYRIALQQAQARLAASQAELASAQAQFAEREADFARQSELARRGDVARAILDQSRAKRDEASAGVQKAEASVREAEAAVARAEIDLGHTEIRSPIAGQIGATNVTVGNLVGPGSSALATVVQLDPIRAVFGLPSHVFMQVMEDARRHGIEDARERYVAQLLLPTGAFYPHPGRIAFADNRVDPNTGSVSVSADFPNPGGLLLPGQFVTAVIGRAEEDHLPMVPVSAVQQTRDGYQVYVVDAENRVALRRIEIDAAFGTEYPVRAGLSAGERVIRSGIQKVQPGMLVAPTPAIGQGD